MAQGVRGRTSSSGMLACRRPLHRPARGQGGQGEARDPAAHARISRRVTDLCGSKSLGLPTRGLALACLAAACALAVGGCATGAGAAPRASGSGTSAAAKAAGGAVPDPASPPSPYPSTYRRQPSAPVLLAHATLLTAAGRRLDSASVLFRDGKIAAAGPDAVVAAAASDAQVVDATGKWVTPGLIDPHSHLGVYASPAVAANADGNEATNPDTAEVWAEHSVWPQDPQFPLALAGGVTTLQILPGSANLFGGRTITVKNVPALGDAGTNYPGAPHRLKKACGASPHRAYRKRGHAPRGGDG